MLPPFSRLPTMTVATRTQTAEIRFRCELGVLALYDVCFDVPRLGCRAVIFVNDRTDEPDEEKTALLRLVCFIVQSVSNPEFRWLHLYEHDTYLSMFDNTLKLRIAGLSNRYLIKRYLIHFMGWTEYPGRIHHLVDFVVGTDFQSVMRRVGISIRRHNLDGNDVDNILGPIDQSESDETASDEWVIYAEDQPQDQENRWD
jgi:hypothetical protein